MLTNIDDLFIKFQLSFLSSFIIYSIITFFIFINTFYYLYKLFLTYSFSHESPNRMPIAQIVNRAQP